MQDEPNTIDQATAALRGQSWAASPAVSRLRTDVRSGENFLMTTTAGKLPDLFVGGVVIEWGFEVVRNKAVAFHAWLVQNETQLASEAPAGVQYRGTYGVFAQSDNSLGAYRTIWAFDSMATMDVLAKEVANGTAFGKRMQELTAFRDESIGASRSQQIYHPAATAQRT